MSLSSVIEITAAWLADAVSEKARGYSGVKAEYKSAIKTAMDDYLTSQDKATAHKSAYKRAMNEAFPEAFYIGYEEASGSREDVDRDADEWLTARMNEEIGYIDQLFVSLKQLRDSFIAGDIKIADLRDEVAARADGYLNSLDIVYNTGRLYGKKNIMLTMVGDDGADSCKDCEKRKGKRYSARKWLAIGFPPSRDFECRGYRCQHYLVDDDGNQVTL